MFRVDVFENIFYYATIMSFTQVIKELPTLTRPQRREVALRLFEMESTEAEAGDIAICEHSAAIGFAMLDSMEAEDAAK
jgi:hypothetical protein